MEVIDAKKYRYKRLYSSENLLANFCKEPAVTRGSFLNKQRQSDHDVTTNLA